MFTVFIALGSLYALGAVLMSVEFHFAPEGYEDETGFHVVWKNNDPDRADVACVWDAGVPAAA